MLGFGDLDRVLRGEFASAEARATISVKALLRVGIVLAAFYGACMGVYGIAGRETPEFRYMAGSAAKVPALLMLTILVTFPSLYVFNTLLGSRLRLGELARLLAAALGVLIAVLAAFGPIVAFFSVTTSSYPFILLLNVFMFAAAGALGIGYLQKMLGELVRLDQQRRAAELVESVEVVEEEDDEEVKRPRRPRRPEPEPTPTRSVFTVWMALFALVGAQMSWVLRPFIGSPTTEFAWFRQRESSFFAAVMRSLGQLFAEG